jgi:hypothetical protein
MSDNIEAAVIESPRPLPPEPPDEMVPDSIVQREFNVHSITLRRWDKDESMLALGWPPGFQIKNRWHHSRRGLERFKAILLDAAMSAVAER